jgi:hypothetical protein
MKRRREPALENILDDGFDATLFHGSNPLRPEFSTRTFTRCGALTAARCAIMPPTDKPTKAALAIFR